LTQPLQRAPGKWQIATVTSIEQETPRVKSFRFELPMWIPHLPGQHYDVRLTAPDGYQTERSYSIASSPLDKGTVELTIDRLYDGEVSPYFHDVVEVGDQVELRGPFASYFVWRGEQPVLLVGGGSGIVPLMAMVRARRAAGVRTPFKLIYSLRTPAELYYAEELRTPLAGLDVTYVYTRELPEGRPGIPRRIDVATLNTAAWPAEFGATCFVCGPTGFVETVADILVALGHDPHRIRTERFGPSRD
jgi:ferredoxin-NADP reductase